MFNLAGVEQLKIRGIANISSSFHKINYTYTEIAKNSVSRSSNNYSV